MAYTTIKKPSDYFNTKLYTGDATDDRSITGVGFQPDFSWVKRRDSAGSHRLKDSIRGATKTLISNSTNAESTEANVFQAFESDGFQLGSDSALNASGGTYASWNWLASNTTASNTDGSITSTVSANTTSGFSIVTYTGTGANATVGHGLGVAPKMIIVKRLETADNWEVYHESLGNGTAIRLNLNEASFSTSGRWNNTSPTSSVFSLGTATVINASGENYIAYCFAEKKGFSKFGSYTGNGSTDGTFVYTGMRPAFVMIKRTDTANVWHMIDNKRNTFNTVDKVLFAEDSSAEATSGSNQVDFLSNGFKARNSGSQINASGGTYIYMAFAEEPLVGDNPCTAR